MATTKTIKVLVILLTIAAVALTGITFAAITVNQNVASSGSITTSPNIGVYSDSSCNTAITSINWGTIAVGGSTTQTIYVKNTGTGTLTLSLSTSSWSPSGANAYITVSWNRENAPLTAGQSVAATITLTVSSSITGITSFSNTITITGTG